MSGAYCQFCGKRCFVDRVLPDGSWHGHMATCREGMAHDRKVTGYDHTTAINPLAQTAQPANHEDCPEYMRDSMSVLGAEVFVGTVPWGDEYGQAAGGLVCPHGTTYYPHPTDEQVAQWEAEGVR